MVAFNGMAFEDLHKMNIYSSCKKLSTRIFVISKTRPPLFTYGVCNHFSLLGFDLLTRQGYNAGKLFAFEQLKRCSASS